MFEPQNGLKIDVPIEEVVHRFVPESVELLIGCAVPPVIVELSIGKEGKLSKDIGHVLEYDIEEQYLHDGVGDDGSEQKFKETDLLPLVNVDQYVIRVDYVCCNDSK